jgi:hypothetical protein
MFIKTLCFLLGFSVSYSTVYAFKHGNPLVFDEVDDTLAEVDIDHPFVALRPPNAARLVDDLEALPKILVPPMIIEARIPRSWRHPRRPVRRVLVAARAPLAPPVEPEAQELLRETLDRASIASTMQSIRRGVQQCYDVGMMPGRVNLRLAVYGQTGRVAAATVDTSSSTGRCIRKLARGLRFPRFARTTLTIQYPYDLR